jgi:hypothetical protein
VKKQRVSFSGAAMHTDDSRWYLEDDNISNTACSATDNFGNPSSSSRSFSADVAISIADNVDQPSVGEEPLMKKLRLNVSASSDNQLCIADSVDEPSIINEPHTKKPRMLERYNTEEAVAKAFGTSNE